MKIEQIYTECLAEATYYIESNGEAVIIDPLRETEPYLELLQERGVMLKYIFETHFHADFVSGHVDLAKATGATIVYGPGAETTFNSHVATDGEELKLGDLIFRVLHTPGHTIESSTYLMLDEGGKEHAIFTGDTLFIGDVGRPDLAVKGEDITQDDLAGYLYDSLRTKIMTLPDQVLVYPAHGAGSSCGKGMSDDTWDTLGHQKETNYALRTNMTKDEFIEEVTNGLLTPPQYFAKNAAMNKQGYEDVNQVVANAKKALTSDEVEMEIESGAIVLDTRSADDFAKGFIPSSINIGLNGSFAPWVGTLLENIKQRIVIVANDGEEKETAIRLARVGYDNIAGYAKRGVDSWVLSGRPLQTMRSIKATELVNLDDTEVIIDVRKITEFQSEHVNEAMNRPINDIYEWINELDTQQTYYLHCKSGYRSMIAASILQAKGFENVVDITGGFDMIKETTIKRTDHVCPSTL